MLLIIFFFCIASVNKIWKKCSESVSSKLNSGKNSADSFPLLPPSRKPGRHSSQIASNLAHESPVSFNSLDISWGKASNKKLSIKNLLPCLLDEIKSPHGLKRPEENSSFDAQLSISPEKGSLCESGDTSDKGGNNIFSSKMFR